ncbi:hypothetical protein ACX80S_13415 [Arthrobacter sp. RHLT1-20]
MTGWLLFGSAVNQEHGDIVTNSDNAHQAARPAAAGERPSLNDLDLSPQGLADAPASQADPDSLVYAGNS